MNRVALVGRVTKDPVLRRLSEGRLQSSFILAVTRNYKNRNGETEADFVLCTTWGKNAENVAKHCGKGSLIGVGGHIQSRSYEREDRSRVYVTEVVGEDIRFLATKKRTESLFGDDATSLTEEVKPETHFNLPTKETEGLPIF